jgi:hypothetical protein
MLNWLYASELMFLYPGLIILLEGSAGTGAWLGRRFRDATTEGADIGTLTGAALGLLALLLGFSFSLALSRYDARRALVLEEANAIGTTANFALMLPEPARGQILSLLRDYTEVRIGLGAPYDPSKLNRDIAQSLDLQARLWRQAAAVTEAAPQSLPAYRFVASLNEVTNVHESRLTALRYHVPDVIILMLTSVAMVAMGFTGYQAGVTGSRRRVATLIMSLTIGMVLILVVDLDQPARGWIRVPAQPLVDTAQGMPP